MKASQIFSAALTLILVINFSSCKKKNETPGLDSDSGISTMILGKWSADSLNSTSYYQGQLQYSYTYFPSPTDYYNFYANGILAQSMYGDQDSSNYILLGDDRVEMYNFLIYDRATFDILSLNSTNMQLLYTYEDSTAPNYSTEYTIYMSK